MKVYAKQVPPENINGYSVYCIGWNNEQIKNEIAEVTGAKPEEISGFSIYCVSWNTEGIKKEIAGAVPDGDPADVVLYEFAGYSRTAVYREVEA